MTQIRTLLIRVILSTVSHHNHKVRITSGIVITLAAFALIHLHSELIVVRWMFETLGGAVQFIGLVPFVNPLFEKETT